MIKKWIKKFNEKLHSVSEDDRGSAFVMVVIGVMATAIIGATILSLATNYFVSVVVDQQGTDNYYETEGFIAEIRSGIEEIAGESNEVAYTETLKDYNSSDGNLQDKYAQLYLSGIIYGIKNGKSKFQAYIDDIRNNSGGKIDFAKIVEEYNPDTNLNMTGDIYYSQGTKYFPSSVLQSMVTRKDTIVTSDVINYVFYKEKETGKRWLTLKNVKVSYKDEKGYQTDIQTDIVINVPDYRFEGDDTFNQLKNYIVICDDELNVEGKATVGFNGNVYTGGVSSKDTLSGAKEYDYQDGIIASSESNVTFDSKTIITRGALNVLTGAKVKVNQADFWAKNVLLSSVGDSNSTLKSSLDLECNSYVLDDLSVDDNNASVKIGKTYYGYSYNIDNTKGESDDKHKQLADYSSAILVNGRNTLLDASSTLSKLVLAGRAFVQRNDQSGIVDSSVEDIAMGESASIKSNQVAYLVPSKYIIAGHNPLVYRTKDNSSPEFNSVDLKKNYNTTSLLGDMKDEKGNCYLNEAEPVTFNYNNATGFVYLYLNFKDEQWANKYFANYYSDSNPDNVDYINERAQTYITSDIAADPTDGILINPTLYLLAGNVIKNYYTGANGSNKLEANYLADNVSNSLLLDGRKKMIKYMSLQLALVNGKYTASSIPRMEEYAQDSFVSDKKIELVADRIVDFSKVKTGSDLHKFDKGAVYITQGSIKSLSSCMSANGFTSGLVIAKGDVCVDCDFEGLILSAGKVSVQLGGTYKEISNASMLTDILDWIKKDETWKEYFYSTKKEGKETSNVADCISYENWTKN